MSSVTAVEPWLWVMPPAADLRARRREVGDDRLRANFSIERSDLQSPRISPPSHLHDGMATSGSQPACKNLVLDAGPLLSFSPLRNLAQTYYIVPQVISELKDPRAKQHFESLALNAGVRIQVRDPTTSSLAHS